MSVTRSETEDDPRLTFVYQEALRGLLQQQAAVESLHNRAATLVFAASFASSLAAQYPRVAALDRPHGHVDSFDD